MALVTINGKELQVDDGELILDVARKAGYEIPTFCYHAKLTKLGSCRMCLVEIEGMRKLQPSCVTPVMEGMKVQTESETVITARKAQMEFLLINHPLDCPVCDQAGECELQDHVFKFGNAAGRYRWEKRTFEKRDMGPSIIKEMNRCIACRRCSRYCSEISGDYAISEFNRGNELEMGSFCHTPIESEFVGNTAQICPVGALTSKPFKFKARSWDLKGTETVCTHCSVGCSITSETKYVSQSATQMLHTQSVGRTEALEKTEVRVLRNSATEDKGVTDISICDRGRYGYHYINSDKRLTAPLVRENGKLIETTWENALSVAALKLADIAKESGADSIGGVTSGRCNNEAAYLFQNFLREVIGTNNIDLATQGNLSRNAAEMLLSMRGNVREVKYSDAVLILGSSVSTDTPIISMNAGIAARMGDAKLITFTAGENRLLLSGPKKVSYVKGAEPSVIAALTKAVIENKLYEKSFDGERKKELDAVSAGLKGVDLAKAAASAGITAEDLVDAAKTMSQASKGSIIFGEDFAWSGTSDNVQSIYNLVSLLGYTGAKGQTIYAPAPGNLKGNMDMGVAPDYLTGYGEVKGKAGLTWNEMLSASNAGKLKALYIMGDNPVETSFNGDEVRSSLEKLDFLIVQDLFLSETAAMAHVVFPAVAYAEQSGTVTNLEGRIQQLNQSLNSPGSAMADWFIIAALASAMGRRYEYKNVGEITNEIIPAQVERDGLVQDASKVRQPALLGVAPVDVELPKAEKGYDLTIVPGRDVFLSSSLTWMDEGLMLVSPGARALVSLEDASRLDLKDGDRVAVETSAGSLETVVSCSDKVSCGTVVVPLNHPGMDCRQIMAGTGSGTAGRLIKKS